MRMVQQENISRILRNLKIDTKTYCWLWHCGNMLPLEITCQVILEWTHEQYSTARFTTFATIDSQQFFFSNQENHPKANFRNSLLIFGVLGKNGLYSVYSKEWSQHFLFYFPFLTLNTDGTARKSKN